MEQELTFGLDLGQLALGGVHKLCLRNLTFFDHLPPSVYIFYGIKVYKKSIFLTTYPPPLVNVVCERPLTEKSNIWADYEQLLRPVLSSFRGQKNKNIYNDFDEKHG